MDDPRLIDSLRGEIAQLRAELARETATRLDYERSITFETSCVNCARLLEKLHIAEARAEKAEADLRAAQPVLQWEAIRSGRTLGHPVCAGCDHHRSEWCDDCGRCRATCCDCNLFDAEAPHG